jgi:hypothetical protein
MCFVLASVEFGSAIAMALEPIATFLINDLLLVDIIDDFYINEDSKKSKNKVSYSIWEYGLQIEPVIHFKNYRSVLIFHERISEIVIAIHQENITHGLISPLQSTVDIEIISLVVVLQEGGPEQIIGKIYFNTWCNQEQVVFSKFTGEP